MYQCVCVWGGGGGGGGGHSRHVHIVVPLPWRQGPCKLRAAPSMHSGLDFTERKGSKNSTQHSHCRAVIMKKGHLSEHEQYRDLATRDLTSIVILRKAMKCFEQYGQL